MRFHTLRPWPASLPRWWGTDQVVVPYGDGDTRPAAWLGAVLSLDLLDPGLQPPCPLPAGLAGCPRVIADAGRFAAPSDDQPPISNWSPRARARLDAACANLAPALSGAGLRLALRPHAGNVLSDVPSCLTFLRGHADGPFELFLDPAALLTDSMLGDARDHLDRILGSLLEQPRVIAVVVTNLRRDGQGALVPAPVHSGLLEPGLLTAAAIWARDAGRPIVLVPEELGGQVAVLDSARARS